MAITGLSTYARALAEAEWVLRSPATKRPDQPPPGPMPGPDEVRLFRLPPTVKSALDYSGRFGHTDLVTC
jgi:hypothetical protein